MYTEVRWNKFNLVTSPNQPIDLDCELEDGDDGDDGEDGSTLGGDG